jgi:hypothetical protein
LPVSFENAFARYRILTQSVRSDFPHWLALRFPGRAIRRATPCPQTLPNPVKWPSGGQAENIQLIL